MNKRTVLLICILIALVPAVYLAIIWDSLPETIPTHWGTSSKPDAYGKKATVILLPALLGGVTLLTCLVVLNLDKLDPKKGKNINPAVRNKLALSLSVFLTAICTYIIYVTQSSSHEMGNFLFLLMGLFFIFLGNIMYSVKQNYFVGVRLPWTLEDEDNWNRTNRIVSILFFITGIVTVIAALLLPGLAVIFIMLGSLLVSIAYAIIFSYRLFKKKQHSS